MDMQKFFDVISGIPAAFKAIRERLEKAEAQIEKLAPLAAVVEKFDIGALTAELQAFAGKPSSDSGKRDPANLDGETGQGQNEVNAALPGDHPDPAMAAAGLPAAGPLPTAA